MRATPAETLPRAFTILVTATAVLAPLSLILYQSLLSAPFFDATKAVGLDAYRFIFDDSDFWQACRNSFLIAAGMTLIAVPFVFIVGFMIYRGVKKNAAYLEQHQQTAAPQSTV